MHPHIREANMFNALVKFLDRKKCRSDQMQLWHAIDMLPEECRQALMLQVTRDCSLPQIGRQLGLSDDEVADRLRFARLTLLPSLGL